MLLHFYPEPGHSGQQDPLLERPHRPLWPLHCEPLLGSVSVFHLIVLCELLLGHKEAKEPSIGQEPGRTRL